MGGQHDTDSLGGAKSAILKCCEYNGPVQFDDDCTRPRGTLYLTTVYYNHQPETAGMAWPQSGFVSHNPFPVL